MQRPHARERWKVLADPIPHDPLHSFRRKTAPLWEWILEPGRDGQGKAARVSQYFGVREEGLPRARDRTPLSVLKLFGRCRAVRFRTLNLTGDRVFGNLRLTVRRT
jgi:hypothetical protein